MSTEFGSVDSVGMVPLVGNLNEAGHLMVRLPIESWIRTICMLHAPGGSTIEAVKLPVNVARNFNPNLRSNTGDADPLFPRFISEANATVLATNSEPL